jgi:formylglycine-generating enzyme required for sulfatase activity
MPPSFPPDWASAWGSNNHSPYPFADLKLSANVRMRFRWIPPGRFLMGSPQNEVGRRDWEGPQHWVEFSFGLWLAETPCTQAEWLAIMQENPSRFKGDDACPVEHVSWDDCQSFCQKLNERMPELGARLPTEAEWEYACRADTLTGFNDGSDCTVPEGKDPSLDKLGWYSENSEGKTHPVRHREFKANAWGIHDMHGNVYEWCQDFYGEYSTAEQRDPLGRADGSYRVTRGGCWGLPACYCRSARRERRHSSDDRSYLGFRLAAGPVSQAERAERGKGQ